MIGCIVNRCQVSCSKIAIILSRSPCSPLELYGCSQSYVALQEVHLGGSRRECQGWLAASSMSFSVRVEGTVGDVKITAAIVRSTQSVSGMRFPERVRLPSCTEVLSCCPCQQRGHFAHECDGDCLVTVYNVFIIMHVLFSRN